MEVKSKSLPLTLTTAVGGVFVATLAASPVHADTAAAANPFMVADLGSGYQVAAEGKCGEGKCGGSSKDKAEDKAGEGNCAAEKKGEEGTCAAQKEEDKEKGGEGKCGEGKCASA